MNELRIKITAIFIILLVLNACGNSEDRASEETVRLSVGVNTQVVDMEIRKAEETDSKEIDMGEIYCLALDAFLSLEDGGLTKNMKYLAMDLSNLKDTSAEDKQKLVKSFGKYGVDVMDATLEQLEQEGQLKEARGLEGVLLRVESTDISEAKVVIKGSVYKSAKGGAGTEVTIEYQGGKWEVTQAKNTWVS